MPRGKKSIDKAGKAALSKSRASTPRNAKVSKSTKGGSKAAKALARNRQPSIFASILGTPARNAVSVLIRPTAKTLAWRKFHGKDTKPVVKSDDEAVGEVVDEVVEKWMSSHEKEPDRHNVFNRKLDAELRNQIYRLVVVNDEHFLYPSSTPGREQPDLAMTCRAVREDVLELYYAENTFALELGRFRNGPGRTLAPPAKWLTMLDNADRLKYIKHWAFTDEVLRSMDESEEDALPPPGQIRKRFPETLIISLILPNDEFSKEMDVKGTTPDNGTSNEMDLNRSASVRLEVHCDARCPEHNHAVQALPTWFNDIVIAATGDETDNLIAIRAPKMIKMLKSFAKHSPQILGLRCNEIQDD